MITWILTNLATQWEEIINLASIHFLPWPLFFWTIKKLEPTLSNAHLKKKSTIPSKKMIAAKLFKMLILILRLIDT